MRDFFNGTSVATSEVANLLEILGFECLFSKGESFQLLGESGLIVGPKIARSVTALA